MIFTFNTPTAIFIFLNIQQNIKNEIADKTNNDIPNAKDVSDST